MEQPNLEALWTTFTSQNRDVAHMLMLYQQIPDLRPKVVEYFEWRLGLAINARQTPFTTRELTNILSIMEEESVLRLATRQSNSDKLSIEQLMHVCLQTTSIDLANRTFYVLRQRLLFSQDQIRQFNAECSNGARWLSEALYKQLRLLTVFMEAAALSSHLEIVRTHAAMELFILFEKCFGENEHSDKNLLNELSASSVELLRFRIQIAVINVYSASPDTETRERADAILQETFYELMPNVLLFYAIAMDDAEEAVGAYLYAYQHSSAPDDQMLPSAAVCARTEALATIAMNTYLIGDECNLAVCASIAADATFESIQELACSWITIDPRATNKQLETVIQQTKQEETRQMALQAIEASAETALQQIYAAFEIKPSEPEQAAHAWNASRPWFRANAPQDTEGRRWHPIICQCKK